jgi:pimeloyl-ACP methyl ester carboxylesterase
VPAACVVLVHGLWHGAWSWDLVRHRLDEAGIASAAAELPMTTLADDAAIVRRTLDEMTTPIVLVGHSYGGAVITAAGGHPHVRRLVYLAAFQLDAGESIGRAVPAEAIAPTRLGDALRFSNDGNSVSIDSDLARDVLYGQAPIAEVDAALDRIRPVGRAVFSGRPDAIAWTTVPSTYAVCTEDQAVAPDLQRAMARRASTVVEWASDHSPQVSHPELVADLLIAYARA